MLTGTSADRAGKGGAVVFYDAKTHELVRRVAMPSSAVGLAWHERLNQIFVGVGAPFSELDLYPLSGVATIGARHAHAALPLGRACQCHARPWKLCFSRMASLPCCGMTCAPDAFTPACAGTKPVEFTGISSPPIGNDVLRAPCPPGYHQLIGRQAC